MAALEVDDIIIIHILEHQQDDDYVDDCNNDLTDLMQDNLELEVMEQEFE